ncbi:MAG: DUF2621 family protein [Acidobacteria bacterium]|nr:DUF2621 family protein [Acidobacteriaceae bacterium]MBV9609891.1 DUF2621 family protein [Acidobacteriota bacterium]
MLWTDEAREILEDLLQELPLPVRDGVRDAAQFRAEALAESAGKVSLETAVRAFIESTPMDLRERLKHTLTYKGIDPEEYEAAFSS